MRPNHTRPALIKLAAVLSATILLASLAGTNSIQVRWADPLEGLKHSSKAASEKGDFDGSARLAALGLRESAASHNERAKVFFLETLGLNRWMQRRFSEALSYLLDAERAASKEGDRAAWTRIVSNIANLYFTLGDYPASREKVEAALKHGDYSTSESALRITLGRIGKREGNPMGVDENLIRGYELADKAGNNMLAWLALDELGEWKLLSGDLTAAEHFLAAAFRRQRMQGDRNIAYSYIRLAALKLRQGDPEFALRLSDLAIENLARGNMAMAPYFVWQERGPILEALGRPDEAAESYRRAIDLARHWRAGTRPTDRTQTILADGFRTSIYDRFVGLTAERAIRDGSESAAWDAFGALEENRASALAATTRLGSMSQNTIKRQESLAALRELEIRIATAESAELRAQADKLRREIDETQALVPIRANGPENFSSGISLSQFKAGLSESQALFSFSLASAGCYRWSVSRSGFTLQQLPSCGGLGSLVAEFRDRLERREDSTALGEELYRRLFFDIPEHAASRADWLFSLDDALWELPMPALVARREGGTPVYLMERHSLATIPSALLRRPGTQIQTRGRLVGLGDAVYNLADSRYPVKNADWTLAVSAMALPSDRSGGSARLNRLVASGNEVLAAANLWRESAPGQQAILLTGLQATRKALVHELSRPTAAVHIAAHVLSSKTRKDEAVIAMSIDDNRAVDALSAADISTLRLPGSLVILNGCGSGRGEIHRGAGLLGLTRAWLIAGAGGVISSQWDMPDDAAGLFPAFYRHWIRGEDSLPVAEALRRAQVEMLHSGTWRANPGFWAAYSMTGVAQ